MDALSDTNAPLDGHRARTPRPAWRGRVPVVWLLGAMALIPLVVLAVLLLAIAWRSTARSSAALGQQVIAAGSQRVEESISRYLDRAVRESDMLATLVASGVIGTDDLDIWRSRLFPHVQANPEISSIGVVNAALEYVYVCRYPQTLEYGIAKRREAGGQTSLQTFAATPDGTIDLASRRVAPFDVASRPWYRLAVASPGPVWTPVYNWVSSDASRTVTERGVAYTRAIRDTSGRVTSVLSLDLSLSRVDAFLDAAAKPMHAFMFVSDAAGERIGQSSAPPEGVGSRVRVERALLDHFARDGRGAEPVGGIANARSPQIVIDGERYWARRVELSAAPSGHWYLTMAVPERAVLADAQAGIVWMLSVGAACLLATAAAAIWAARQLSAPVQRMAAFAREVGAGHFDRRLVGGTTRETAQLTAALNAMAQNLRDRVGLLAQRDAAQEAGALKARVVAHVSHDFRTPLNAILGYGEMMHEALHAQGRTAEARDAANILIAGRHLLRLVETLLDLSRAEAGRLPLDVIDFPLHTLLDEVVVTARGAIEKNGNRFAVDRPAGRVDLRSDPDRIKQVLLNLLDNAGKFTNRGDVSLDVRVEGDRVVFCVGDTGPGIPSDDLARIFEPFAQARRPDYAYQDGAGLGLAIARQVCQALHGSIDVDSEPGRGTRFTVRLPLRFEQAQAIPDPPHTFNVNDRSRLTR